MSSPEDHEFTFETWRTEILELAKRIARKPAVDWFFSQTFKRDQMRSLAMQSIGRCEPEVFDTLVEAIQGDHGEFLEVIEALLDFHADQSASWLVDHMPGLISRAPQHAALLFGGLLTMAFRQGRREIVARFQ